VLGVRRRRSAADLGSETAVVAAQVRGARAAGRDTLLFTRRQVRTGADQESSLRLSERVSAGPVDVVRRLDVAPRYLIAKGGITASDLATDALGVRRAEVPGQVAPGVPCWLLGPTSRFPGIPYVIFPGNVGTSETLAQVIGLLSGSA